MEETKYPWPHAPTHQLARGGTFFVTASTYQKAHFFKGAERLSQLHQSLLEIVQSFKWQLEAWSVFSNHYHFVGHSPVDATDAHGLATMLKMLHVKTASLANRLDGTIGRQVWFNFRETKLTYHASYLARLNYTHRNSVKHRLVPIASLYPWCSAGWFERTATAAQVRTIYSFKTDQVQIADEFEPSPDW